MLCCPDPGHSTLSPVLASSKAPAQRRRAAAGKWEEGLSPGPPPPPPPLGDAWLRRVPGRWMLRCHRPRVPLPVCSGGAFTASFVWFFVLVIYIFSSFFLSPPVRPTFLRKQATKPQNTKTFYFSPPSRKSHAVERRGGGGGRNPSPSPPPWLLPRKRNTWGVSSAPLPSALLPEVAVAALAPQPRRARRAAAPPPVSRAPAPRCELRGRGGMRSAAAPGGRARGRLGFASGRESGGGRAGQRRCLPGTERSLAPVAAPPARRYRE